MKLIAISMTIFLCHMVAGRSFFSDFLFDDLLVDVRDCHGIRCPEGTAVCIQNVTTSDDLKTIRTHLVCKDSQGGELLSELKQEENHHEGTAVESFSFRGSYTHSGTGSRNVNVNVGGGGGDADKHKYDAVETFDDY